MALYFKTNLDKLNKGLLLIGVCLLAYNCNKADDNSPKIPQKYTLSVSASEGGNVNTTGGVFNENTSVSITASPAQGYEFSRWIGTSLTGNSIIVKVTSNQTIIANFVRSKYVLTVDTVGSGQVAQQVVNSARETTEYESGNTIRLTATPQSDFLFYDWEYLLNDVSENTYENPLELIMDQSKTVTATFEEKLPLINPENTDKNNTIGKWKIRKKRPGSQSSTSARAVECQVNEIIFRTDNSFTIITETSTITGQYSIDSENSISLNQGETNIGRLTDIILTQNYFSFNIELTGVCNEKLEADRDPTYDESTDPIAPSNTESSTISSRPCTIETELTSDNINQTISVGDSIQDILIAVTVGSTCTETLSVSSSNLPDGVLVSLDNNQITISGTPSSNSVGTFDYDIMLSVASPTIIVNGTITVENNTTTETNPNQGGGGNNSGTNTSTIETAEINCSIETSILLEGTNGPNEQTIEIGESIKDIEYLINTDCEREIKVSNVTGLPDGVLTSISNFRNILGIYGTPTTNVSGTYNFSITIDNHVEATSNTSFISATVSEVIKGSITVINSGTTTSTTSADTTPPVISITGSASVTITEGDSYNDEGAIATDDVRGELTSSIITTNPVDTSTPGTYTVTYTVTDAAGNTTSIGRLVTVLVAPSPETYTINVTASNSSDYSLSGADRNGNVTGNDPSVTVNVGDSIDFVVDASGHPFYLKTVQGTGSSDLIGEVTNNGATNGTVSWTPTASGTYYYQCSLHNGMNGTITVN